MTDIEALREYAEEVRGQSNDFSAADRGRKLAKMAIDFLALSHDTPAPGGLTEEEADAFLFKFGSVAADALGVDHGFHRLDGAAKAACMKGIYAAWEDRPARYRPAQSAPDGEKVTRAGFYVASRASVPARGAAWRAYRAAGVPIISTWIDEDGPGETADFSELWPRIAREIASAQALVMYVEPDDFPVKGVLIEIGLAFASNIPVIIVAPDVILHGPTKKPLGSWVDHPLVSFADTLTEAFARAAMKDDHA